MSEKYAMRRNDRLVSKKRAAEIIQKSEFGTFITASKEGVPYGVTVSHVLEGNAIYFHCAKTGRKLDNIKENSRVCMTFVSKAEADQKNFTIRYESAIVEGEAVLVEDREEKLHALRLICQRYAPKFFSEAEEYILPKLDATAVCRIDFDSLDGKVNEKS